MSAHGSVRAPEVMIYIIEPYGGSARQHNPALPHLYFDDAAVTRGDGVFESVLIRQGRPCNIDRHLDRFTRSAEALGLPTVNREQWEQVTREAAAAWEARHGDIDAACVWTLSKGRASTQLATAWMVVRDVGAATRHQREHGVSVMTTTRGFRFDSQLPDWFPRGAKTLSYATNSAALRHAHEGGFDDVIFLDSENGAVLEGATSSVLVVKKNGKLRTPPTGPGVLGGTTIAAIFDEGTRQGWRCKARALTVDDLIQADSVWLVSSTRVAVQVNRVDDRPLGEGKRDAEVRRLIDAALAGR